MREIALFVVPGASDLDVSLAMEIFTVANGLLDTKFFQLHVITPDAREVVLTTGCRILPTRALETCKEIDFSLVLSHINPDAALMPSIHSAIRHLARTSEVIGGSGQAPLLLASAGLLKKKRATCHIDLLAAGRERFPDVRFIDQLWVRDGNTVTSAGHLALSDMLIDYIQHQHGIHLARALSAELIGSVIRPSTMTQSCGNIMVDQANDIRVRAAIDIMRTHMDAPLSIPRIAKKIGVSTRSLEAAWQRYVGISPNKFYIAERIKYSCSLLLFSDLSITEIAHASGFSSGSSFARTFANAIGISPRQYRNQHSNKIAPILRSDYEHDSPNQLPSLSSDRDNTSY